MITSELQRKLHRRLLLSGEVVVPNPASATQVAAAAATPPRKVALLRTGSSPPSGEVADKYRWPQQPRTRSVDPCSQASASSTKAASGKEEAELLQKIAAATAERDEACRMKKEVESAAIALSIEVGAEVARRRVEAEGLRQALHVAEEELHKVHGSSCVEGRRERALRARAMHSGEELDWVNAKRDSLTAQLAQRATRRGELEGQVQKLEREVAGAIVERVRLEGFLRESSKRSKELQGLVAQVQQRRSEALMRTPQPRRRPPSTSVATSSVESPAPQDLQGDFTLYSEDSMPLDSVSPDVLDDLAMAFEDGLDLSASMPMRQALRLVGKRLLQGHGGEPGEGAIANESGEPRLLEAAEGTTAGGGAGEEGGEAQEMLEQLALQGLQGAPAASNTADLFDGPLAQLQQVLNVLNSSGPPAEEDEEEDREVEAASPTAPSASHRGEDSEVEAAPTEGREVDAVSPTAPGASQRGEDGEVEAAPTEGREVAAKEVEEQTTSAESPRYLEDEEEQNAIASTAESSSYPQDTPPTMPESPSMLRAPLGLAMFSPYPMRAQLLQRSSLRTTAGS